ncbi:hypothetical protein NPIL_491681 [Nephila pilipes]|uniref:Uncharacterized protein n=1 Tax=Nephila pilipes TaxID=299642 RepID=A0A8X6NAC9_NEPPI|nr:hypothetical protein NPIL_491681 [Nephila pilipes]
MLKFKKRPPTKLIKLIELKSPLKRHKGEKSKTDVSSDLQTPVELTNKFSALEVGGKNENLEIEEFPEIQIEKVISPSNENLEEIDESTSVEKKTKKSPTNND